MYGKMLVESIFYFFFIVFYLIEQNTNYWSHISFIWSEQFLIRVTLGTFLWNNFKIGPAVPEEKIYEEDVKKIVDEARRTPGDPKSSA